MNQQSNIAVLHECRDLITKRMRSSITQVMDELDDTLLAMAFNKKEAMSEGLCIDAVREIHMKKDEIKTRFERRYASLFREDIDTRTPDNGTNTGWSRESAKALEKVNNDCQENLRSLHNRVSELLEQPELLINPVRPEAVYMAFQEACSDIESGDEVRKLLFKIFDKHALKELQNVYSELNNLLVGQSPASGGPSKELEQKEQEVILVRYRAMSVLEKQIQGQELPTFIRVFLFKHWRALLEKIYLDKGKENPVWDKALETVDDLVVSVQKVASEEDRKSLRWMLPSLIFRLRNGMRIAGVPVVEKTAFLNKLKNYHLSVLDEKTEVDGGQSESTNGDKEFKNTSL